MPLGRVRPQHDAELSHHRRSVGVVALDVADDGPDPAARQRDDVVPVAADVLAHPRGAVADRDLRALDGGDPARQHRLLEAFRQIVFLLQQHGALKALRDAAAERDEQVPLVLREAVLVLVQQSDRADGAGLGDQRQVGGRRDVHRRDPRPEAGIPGGELGRGVEEARLERPYDLAHRVLVVDTGVAGAGDEAARRALGDEVDAARLDQAHHHAHRAQPLQAVRVADDVDDVPHGAGVCEGRGGALDHRGLAAPLLVEAEPLRRVAELLGGVADDADDPVRAPVGTAHDAALGVGPAEPAVAAADPEIGAVAVHAALEGAGDQGVEAGGLGGRHPRAQ
ncbi:hypothetical protein GCM10020254_16580 [Streptomyces goshikiensis]